MPARFHTTRWSLVRRAAAANETEMGKALGELCALYWPPLYAWLRRRGTGENEAKDLVQSFCVHLIENGGLGGVDRERGTFRHYLLGAFRHFIDNQARAERAAKRGGGVSWQPFDEVAARRALAANADEEPQRAFDRAWALALLDRATRGLRAECAARGRLPLLEALEPALLGDATAPAQRDVAARFGLGEGAVKVTLHRFRARLRELIRAEIADTLDDPAGIDDELRDLFAALGRSDSMTCP